MASIDKRPTGGTGPAGGRTLAVPDQFLDAIRDDPAHGMYVDPAGGRT
jgi:hypothetical protein